MATLRLVATQLNDRSGCPAVIHIRSMTEADIAFGMRLKEQAGWNQVEADWRRFLAISPGGCFVAERDGEVIGTAVGFLFGPVAWIAMVLVDSRRRSQGIGTALVEHTLAFIDQQGATSVRLDATSLGQPVYERLGFVPQYALVRYAGVPVGEIAWFEHQPKGKVELAAPEDYVGIFALDCSVTRTDRSSYLSTLFVERPEVVRTCKGRQRIDGYIAGRPGSMAMQLGPCIASPDAGSVLLADALYRFTGTPCYIDVAIANAVAVRMAEAAGLKPQRTLMRMCRGAQVVEETTRLWASSGPELG